MINVFVDAHHFSIALRQNSEMPSDSAETPDFDVIHVNSRAVYLNIPFLIVVNVLASLVGLVMYAYYADRNCDPLCMGYIKNPNQVYCVYLKLPLLLCIVCNFC